MSILFSRKFLYIISFNHKHKALSTHRMSRIIEAVFASVKIKLSGSLADFMREITWHPTQKIEELPDDDIILSAEVPYLDEAAHWGLAGAPNTKVIEPEELKPIVKDFAMKIID